MRLPFVALLAVLAVLARTEAKDKRQVSGPACVKQDIVYMVDSSTYVGVDNFQTQLDFIKNNIQYYNTNPSCTRVGIVTYSSGAYNQFYLNSYSTQQQLYNAIDNIKYQPGGRNTGDVINFVSSYGFSSSNGGRTGVPHYGVLVSGSSSSNQQLTAQAAQNAANQGITMFTVGVGNGVSGSEMSAITGNVDKNNFYSTGYNSLNTVSAPLATRINGAVSPQLASNLGAPQSCLQQADIVFMVDGSGSIGQQNFNKMENFLKGLVGKLDVGANKVHVGLMQFSSRPQQEFPLNMYTSRQDVMSGMDQMHYMGGGTNTADAIRMLREQLFSTSHGARPNVPRIGVIITDGRSSNSAATATQANSARADNIGLIAVGVGSGVDVNELNKIADDPDSANSFQVSSFDQLDNIAAQIVQRACAVSATAPAPTQKTAGGTPKPDPCQDVAPDCASYSKSVCSGDYFGWAKDNCPRYCGFCVPLYTTAPPPCVDHLSNCNEYQSNSCVGDFTSWAKDNCRKYCGYCDATAQSVGFYGQCYYKGQTYSQGQTWDDGCDYTCTCLDGVTGNYQCYNKCPVYYNLPTECTLVKSNTQCCLQPVCDFKPQIATTQTTSPGKTPDGVDVCVFKNRQYYQGQTWEDGCQFSCTCTDARTGLYKCQTLCPTYASLPNYCHMETKTGECCQKPVCEFQTQSGSFTGTGTISGHGTGVSPTAPPECLDAISDCDRYGSEACTNFKPWARENCRKTCSLCVNNAPNPDPTDVCIYNGQAFHQGDAWQVGCDTTCTCENAVYGYYRCVNTCPTYNNLPSQCTMQKKAGECCSKVICSTGTFISSTGNLGTIGNGGLIQVGTGGAVPTIPSGGTPAPGTGGTIFRPPSLKGCLYKGQVYIQGQRWEDGCQYACQCTNADTGVYQCTAKCPTFPSLPSECVLEVDPNDLCCQKPKCTFTGTPVPVVPVFPPSTSGQSVVEPPKPVDLYQGTQTVISIFTGSGSQGQIPTADPNIHGGIGHCEYKGKVYQQAETWQDGCQYNCVCEDSTRGFYRCNDRCPTYPPLPEPCVMITDPADTCCKKPSCTFTGVQTVIVGQSNITTPLPITQQPIITQPTVPAPKMCVYKNQQYGQGQAWYDGCDFRCTCDNADSGYYRCARRCPEFFNVPSSCTYVPDPNDPSCCKAPQCVPTPQPGQTLAPGAIPTISPGTFVGAPNATGYVGYCEYNGKLYQQGDSWQDGCLYSCSCVDAAKGSYKCVDRCPSYGALPPQCNMVADFTNPCCKKPECNFNGNYGGITGTLTPAPAGPTNAPQPGVNPTPAPAPKYCVYKTASYSQGQTWNDGCQFKCRCDDASRGLYTCNERCPRYENIPAQCTMVTDPNDACCRQPKCDFTPTIGQTTGTLAPNPNPNPNPNPTSAPQPNPIPTKVPSVIIGQANTPAPTPGPNGQFPSPQPLNFCVYKGVQYSQGQTWSDGCDYDCVCLDASIAKYKCVDKCSKYTNIPAQCTLMKDAAKPCCFKPVCNFSPTTGQITGQLTTLAPGLQPTVAPQPGQPTPSPNPVNPFPTPGLPKDVCVYRTDQYTQGQQWYDGCNFKCTCEDAKQGIYRCSERCTKYSSLPAGCTLVADPSDPICCKVPQCAPNPNTNSSQPFPTPPPGHVTGGSVTPAPMPVNTPAPQPGVVTQKPPLNPTPAPTPMCVYKGKTYTQGQRWQDGCDYNCVCLDAMHGRYDCTEICPKYPNLPPQCSLVRDINNPCCQTPSCNFAGTTASITGTLAPTPGGPTLAPSPGYNPTPRPSGPTQAPTPKTYCTYNGVTFKQGQRWDDGCDLQCVCENEMTGYYRCNQRCASYPQVPAGCTLETDPNDPCCRVPVCVNLPTPAPNPFNTPKPNPSGPSPTLAPNFTPGPGLTFAPNPNPTPGPGQTPSPNPTPYIPTLAPPLINGQGVTPTPKPGVTTLSPPIPVCVYNGKSYTQGQTWQDGCQFNCVCVDASTGQYQCSQRCPVYPSIPSYCRMVTSQSDPCCKEPQCSAPPTPQPNPFVTPAPSGGSTVKPPLVPNPVSTISPNPFFTPGPTPQPRQYCVMNGKQYTQNQQWNDGCDRICVCDDQSTGHYKCSDRCKRYTQIPSGCTMVPDPSDPLCCQVPQCIPIPGTNGNPTPSPTDGPIIYTNAPHAVVTGAMTPTPGTTPAPVPGQTTHIPTPAPRVCVYKGQTYLQGQRWQDGCDFDCICDDGMTGKYTCTARCGTYPNLPRQCQLQRDPKDYCCYVPVCDWNSQPTPQPNPYNTPSPNVTPLPGQPTLAPLPGQTPAPTPGPGPTPLPQPKTLCVYNGVTFAQGQTINDGCTQRCRCDDADTNYYNCYDRCATFPNMPANCFMVTDPKDSCCQIPQCSVNPTPAPNPYLTPGPGQTYAPGKYPTLAPGQTYPPYLIPTPGPGMTYAPGMIPTPGPGQTYAPILNPTPAPGQTYAPGKNPTPAGGTYAPGIYPTVVPGHSPYPYPSPSPLPTAVPGVIINKPDPTRPPTQRGFCVYQGIQYTKGQKWNDGCNYNCECLDDMTGQYRCVERCARYPSIPAYCIMVQDPNDQCCKKPSCPGLQPTPAPNMTPAPIPGQTPAPVYYPTPGPGQTYPPQVYSIPTLAPGQQTYAPGRYPTPAPGRTYAPGVYFVPTPAPGQTNAPGRFPTPAPGQTFVPPILLPTPAPGQTLAPGKIPTPAPDSTYPPWFFPTPAPAVYPTPGPGQTYPPGVYSIPTLAPGQQTYAPGRFPTPAPGRTYAPGVYLVPTPAPGQTNAPGRFPTPAPGQTFVPPVLLPTPAPGQTLAPGKIPTPAPGSTYPPWLFPTPGQNPTPAPGYYPTPGPGQTYPPGIYSIPTLAPGQQTYAPGRFPTPAPGRTYAPGVYLVPTPAPGQTNAPGRFPTPAPGQTYVPPVLLPTPAPGQTLAPGMIPTPAPGSTYPPWFFPTPAPAVYPTPGPGQTYPPGVYSIPTLAPGQQTYAPGRFPTPAPGRTYAPGVYLVPTPAPGQTNAPGRFPTPAPGQTYVPPVLLPTPAPGQTLAPGMIPTPAPGSTYPPWLFPTPRPNVTPAPNPTPMPQPIPKDVCIMNGKSYTQGQQWYNGCQQTCVCDDGVTGHYTCNQRCSVYQNIPPTCVYVPDPNDPVCCQIPQCNSPNSTIPQPVTGTHTGGGPQPTPRPNPYLTPSPGLTFAPNPNPQSTVAPPKVCVYKSNTYTQGQSWRDGCQYDCTCDDAMNGKYTCNDICPKYPGLPTYCTMVYDPLNPCCKKPQCSTPAPLPQGTTQVPVPGVVPTPQPNPTPATNFCVYNGIPLPKGQVFNDGCDKVCRCEDPMNNDVVCDDRCPTYPPLRGGCSMVTDPRDSCCQVPLCAPTNPSTNPNTTVITGVPGTISGQNQPKPNPGTGPVVGSRNVCLYKGTMYTTGQTWDDGCTYTCVCVDGNTGSYRCTEKCPRYPKVPAQCSMVKDPTNPCCEKPRCSFIQPTPAPNQTPAPQPGVNPTLSPNPNLTPAPQPGTPAPTPSPRMVCQYKNQYYQQDQIWYDACNAICQCENAATGYYRCQERCAKYPSVPSSCTLVPDPKDPTCCKVASCPVTPPPGPAPTPGFIAPNPNTPAPPQITGIAPVPTPSGPFPTPAPQPGATPNPNATPAPQPKTGCYYKGITYSKGQTWHDGCEWDCVCVDDMTGQYSCNKRCQDYPTVPSQCVLVQDPADACCKKPYCDFLNPTPFPNGIPTPAPNPNQSPAPGPQTTLAPGIVPTQAPPGYCVYKGTFYTQGQTWDDGCEKRCRCDDVSTGYYACTNRCPVYNNYASTCKLVSDPNDRCCLIPDCNSFSITPAPGTGPSGTNSPQNPFNPATVPGVTGFNPNTTPRPQVLVPTYIPGTFTGSSNNNPNGNTQVGPSGKNNVCVYKGAIHMQGDKWDDGCTYQCTCVDQSRGLYSCTERCPRYVNLPPYCTYKTDPRDQCCKVASCDLANIPTPAPVTPTPKPFQPGTNPPVTFQPGTGPSVTGTNSPITSQPGVPITGNRDNCLYKDNTLHPKGSTWQDGCDYTCVCEDPVTNSYRCNARCTSYSDVPSSCFLIADPSDSCCKVPRCSGTLSPITGTGVQPTQPGTNVVPVGTHTTFSGSGRPDIVPGMTATGSRSVCVYKGVVHTQGESWDDGCQYTCTCTDANKGLYTCTSKCPAFPSNIPNYCTMHTVPGMCCKTLSCNIPTLGNYNPAPQLIPTPAPTSSPGATPTPSSGNPPQVIYPGGTQPVIGSNQFPGGGYGIPPGTQITDIRNQCVYKNRIYNQGETWDDGCDYKCECKDAKTGFYECKPLCPVYRTMPQGCYTVKAAGQCCEQPVCQKPDGSSFNPLTTPTTGYPVYGTFNSGTSGFRPGYNPSTGVTGYQTVTGQSNRCIYNGKIYNQGQTWDDGCQYSCECTDAAHGMYSCNPQCPTYTSLPSACRMVTLPGQCCQEPRCQSQPVATFPTPSVTQAPHVGNCFDAINNCNAYGKTSCGGQYEQWARTNCNAYCGYCSTTNTQAPTGCVDKKADCASYGPNACTGQFVPWATDNCAKTCNLCGTTPSPFVTIAPQPTSTGCVDKLTNCVDYGQQGCQGQFQAWAYDNCRKTCNLCTASFNTPGSISGGLPTNNWMIMLKGVAGAPGPDLYSLWNSPNTLNEKVPEAMYLTSQYNGHYKPDLSNYWNSLCIDKVKVAIFNNGVEKANIIFDASGADKNNWFDKSRIISSTWTDIKYAPANLFSMIGDQATGHEFAMTSSGNGCNVQGWMMVATQSNCNFEQGANKPAFYYSPGQTSSNFGTSTPSSGDVFAILAHPNCSGVGPTVPTATITATSNFCIYKQNIYRQGETWTDGCQYNCTCEDGQTGFYKCISLCPVWDNLPSQCTLQKPPGECCDKPVCNGISFGQNNLTNTCFYNGNYYQQGQEWKDGCKYKCSCKDGQTGFYQCNTLCLQWNLPAECTMDPAPTGYCCPVPRCPSNIQIQYPPNFVQQ